MAYRADNDCETYRHTSYGAYIAAEYYVGKSITLALARSMSQCTKGENESTEYLEVGVQRAAADSYSSEATKQSITLSVKLCQ